MHQKKAKEQDVCGFSQISVAICCITTSHKFQKLERTNVCFSCSGFGQLHISSFLNQWVMRLQKKKVKPKTNLFKASACITFANFNQPKQVTEASPTQSRWGNTHCLPLLGGTAKPVDKCRVTLYQEGSEELGIIQLPKP